MPLISVRKNRKTLPSQTAPSPELRLLAETIGAKAVGLVDLPEILPEYDILITCTASTLPIIGLGMVQSALKRRKHRPIFMIDLAVPRDIEREVDDLDEVYVYTVDDLGKVVQSGIQGRKAAVEQADRLIETKVDEFKCWMTTRSSIPQILSLQERADALRLMELEKAKKASKRRRRQRNFRSHVSRPHEEIHS